MNDSPSYVAQDSRVQLMRHASICHASVYTGGLICQATKLTGLKPRPQGRLGVQNGVTENWRLWQTAGHVSPKILEILIVPKWQRFLWMTNLWKRDLLFFSDPGDATRTSFFRARYPPLLCFSAADKMLDNSAQVSVRFNPLSMIRTFLPSS